MSDVSASYLKLGLIADFIGVFFFQVIRLRYYLMFHTRSIKYF